MAFATLQQLRSFSEGEHPVNLDPGQIAFNMAAGNFAANEENYQMYVYVGNGTNNRIDQDGTVLVADGLSAKGWVRYHMRSVSKNGDTIYGDFSVSGSKLSFQVNSNGDSDEYAELIIPSETVAPSNGTSAGSVRWDSNNSILQAWNGSKWDTTTKVVVSETAPATPSNGDLWLDPGPPALLYVYVVPTVGTPSWTVVSGSGGGGGLQAGNGVTANAQNQIDTINTGSY